MVGFSAFFSFGLESLVLSFVSIVGKIKRKSLNIVSKHVFICSNLYIYTTVVQEVFNEDCSPEVDDATTLTSFSQI